MISGSSGFSKSSLNIWKFTVHILLKHGLENFEHYFLACEMSAEFLRIIRRDKIAFLSDQCEEIEENNRMAKTRDLFKKIRDTKRTFHAKMGSIKDRNGMDLKKQKILRRGGKNTQKNCTNKIFVTQIITML